MIHIANVSRRGLEHPERNEDSFYYNTFDNAIAGGLFDGCSSGRDSYFASKLFANVFRQTLENYKSEVYPKNFQHLTYTYFKNLSTAIKLLELKTEETLSTAILFMYSIDSGELMVKFFGDGVTYVNNDTLEIFSNDEANQPDYPGYSIDKLNEKSKFQKYWERKPVFQSVTKDFTILTDGILSFRKTNEAAPDLDIARFLSSDKFLTGNPAMLKRKTNMIRNKGYEHYDDFTAIRIINAD